MADQFAAGEQPVSPAMAAGSGRARQGLRSAGRGGFRFGTLAAAQDRPPEGPSDPRPAQRAGDGEAHLLRVAFSRSKGSVCRPVGAKVPIPCESAAFDRTVWLVRCAALAFEPHARAGHLPGRIVVQQREAYLVATDVGNLSARLSGRLRHEAREAGHPAAGDWVALSLKRRRSAQPPSMPSCLAARPSCAGRPTACRHCRSSPPISTSSSSSPR